MLNKESRFTESSLRHLISQFNQGDNNAFAELWKSISPNVYRLMKQGVDGDTADDLTSEVCIRLYDKGLKRYRPEKAASFITWLFSFSRNLKINLLKKRRPVTFGTLSSEEKSEIEERISPENKSPFQILVEMEEEEIRARAINTLPEVMAKLSPTEQYVLQASIYDEKTDKEISRALDGDDKNEAKYKMMRIRAVRKLERLFNKRGIYDFPVKI